MSAPMGDERMGRVNAATLPPTSREVHEFYATPRSAIDQLLGLERFVGTVWEPACGDGALSRVLDENGSHVISTDLVDRGFGTPGVDFLMEHRRDFDHIVTNPPFKLGTEFVRHALRLTPPAGKVCMLMKIGFLEGPTKADLHEKLARVWVIRRRVTFLKGGREHTRSQGKGGIHTYAWFVWDGTHKGPPTIGWLEGEPCK
jgi:hypothetical protein